MKFDGRLLHGAVEALSAGPPVDGMRCTFLVNVWLNHVPIGLDLYPKVGPAPYLQPRTYCKYACALIGSLSFCRCAYARAHAGVPRFVCNARSRFWPGFRNRSPA